MIKKEAAIYHVRVTLTVLKAIRSLVKKHGLKATEVIERALLNN